MMSLTVPACPKLCHYVTIQIGHKQPRWNLHTSKTWTNVLHGQTISGRGGFDMRKDRCVAGHLPGLISALLMTVLWRHESQLPLCKLSPGCGMPDVFKESNLIKPG